MLENLFFALYISIIIQALFFAIAFTFKTDTVTDLSYGLTFIIITIYYYLTKSIQQLIPVLVTFLIIIWGLRLVIYLLTRILKTKKDSRFDKIRGNFLKFASFWLFQAIAIWIILLPALITLNSTTTVSINLIIIFGLIIWLLGFTIEAVADQQKFQFKSDPKNKDRWITSGLWKYSRHPNYFGEMLVWWGIFIIAIPCLTSWLWLAIEGPIFITFILIFVSGIPPLEKRYDKKYANNTKYQDYKNKTSLLIPLPIK
ncbi:hypothetical protein A2164_04215 [Candidatus Curtissbacteria bacterium RBG_13_35_7]|uniref:Uncharacterized protein n=1 Tax=Candidatus Curtissbacteria bacterium RBG_13_35_7 TaxID=1797705 RepID=A0A1F5G523_9BACT|nr:MAG: hypothetical protein A2164_04215 [Candidatus Curtissbacteria bacterium RBG_13_35_7]